MEGKFKEQPRFAVDGTEDTVRTADRKVSHRNLLSTLIEFQRSPKKDLSSNKHKLRWPGGKYVIASEEARLLEEGITSESKPKVGKVDSDEEDSDFECYDRSEGKQYLSTSTKKNRGRQTNTGTATEQIGRIRK